jgi:hypothetical protein
MDKRNRLIFIVKLILLSILLYFVGAAIMDRTALLNWQEIKLDYTCVLFMLGSEIITRIFFGLLYGVLLRLFNEPLPVSITLSMSWAAALGKYLPGKVGIIAGAMYVLSLYRVNAAISAIVPVLCNVMAIVIALLISLPLLLLPWAKQMIPFPHVWLVVLVLGGFISLWPRFFLSISNFLLRIIHYPPINIHLKFKQMAGPLCMVLAQCISMGMTAWFMARALTPLDMYQIPLFISISNLAAALGFLVLFSPAGLGVREGIYLMALSPIIGSEFAAVVAVGLRCMQTFTDVIMGLGGMIWLRVNLSQSDEIGRI